MVSLPNGEAARDRAPVGGNRGTSGAVYVEFLIAFLPLFFFFLGLVQLIFVQTANIIVKHAVTKAVRAAIVVLPDDPKYYGGVQVGSYSGKRKEDIELAAKVPLSTMGPTFDGMKLDLKGGYSRDANLNLRLEYDYSCMVPWGRFVVCGFSNKKHLVAEAAMPSQGADYEYTESF